MNNQAEFIRDTTKLEEILKTIKLDEETKKIVNTAIEFGSSYALFLKNSEESQNYESQEYIKESYKKIKDLLNKNSDLNKTTKNIERLAEYGEDSIREELRLSLRKVEIFLNNLSEDTHCKSDINELRGYDIDFSHANEVFKACYGVEFPELEKEYNKFLPEINKCLGIKG